MPKFGSYKLVFNITNYDRFLYFNVDCLDIDFTGFKIKGCERIYENKIEMGIENYEQVLFMMLSEIKDLLKEKQITKSVNILNLASNQMFYEQLTIPKLSYLESSKALDLDLTKYYQDYNTKFVYDFVKMSTSAHTNTFNIAFFDSKIYNHLLRWFKDLRINLNYVSISFNSIQRLLNKTNAVNKKRTCVFVNMNKFTTEVISYDGKRIEGSRIVNNGYDDFIKALSVNKELEENQILELLNTENSVGIDLEDDVLIDLVKDTYNDLIIEIKRVIGEFFINQPIDNIYLNIENFDTILIKKALSKILKLEFTPLNGLKPNILRHLSSYGAVLKLQKASDYIFTTRINKKVSNE